MLLQDYFEFFDIWSATESGLYFIVVGYLVLIFCLTISIAQALYYVDGRHRWTIEPFILVFSACAIQAGIAKFNKKV